MSISSATVALARDAITVFEESDSGMFQFIVSPRRKLTLIACL
jgi:hypothetical protein